MSLSDLNLNERCVISKLNLSGIMRRRLMDVGFLPGSIVECVLLSPSLNPKAYFVKGSVIALRNSDASLIEVDIL
jgi:ferrous iron transport protein A